LLTGASSGAMHGLLLQFYAMSEEQLAALLAKLKDDAGLQEKLKGAADLDAAVAMAREAGFEVRKADWLRYQAKQTLELTDQELEAFSGASADYCSIHCNDAALYSWGSCGGSSEVCIGGTKGCGHTYYATCNLGRGDICG